MEQRARYTAHAADISAPAGGGGGPGAHDRQAPKADDPAATAHREDAESLHAFTRLIARASNGAGASAAPPAMAVVWPCEQHALEAAVDAARAGIATPVLVGCARTIGAVARHAGLDLHGCAIEDTSTPQAAAETAVAMVHAGRAHALMKGSLHTDNLMHAIVAPQTGLCTQRRVSHVFIIATARYDELLFVTDAAINIAPDLMAKRDIVQNAIDLHVGLGLGTPRVALLSAVETLNPRIQGTIDAACLCKMAERGQITGGLLDGPLAMDNAVDPQAARIKGIVSPVAGRAQILVAPDLEAGNMLAKNLIYMTQADSAGLVLGAKVPVVLTSRADSVRARMASIAMGAVYARYLATRADGGQGHTSARDPARSRTGG
ncbi:bifunctional enoyl-CoA hydratase/phosphate acetyltransferase [Acetobacter sp. TBRC 12305]|uniref:Bifunctional enoyl-CoA hydratase/phosphate acetyltransferase n=2 Tax=Acetobacter garciniae TaxID=2817435 RepID=A0A939KRK0_9PROT|nr:bifunctional enoyl-CoA hydratase/phosphate acetyltransferase [Acetobacter garciniae]MBX0344772.1 bifunctional enoyl-CoA hydratase/phosphate acetyltransferase [Acetobacter garciniae]